MFLDGARKGESMRPVGRTARVQSLAISARRLLYVRAWGWLAVLQTAYSTTSVNASKQRKIDIFQRAASQCIMAQPESDHEDIHEVADEPESDNEAISVEAQSDNEEVSGEPESDHEDVTAETEEDIQEQTGDGEPPGPPPQPHLPAGAYLGVLEASSGSSDGSGSDEEDRGPRRRRRQYSSVRLQRRRGRLEGITPN